METLVSESNPELAGKQKQKRSGKKKKKFRNLGDPHITSHNGMADEAENPLSALSSPPHSVSCAEPGATLHHTFSTRKDPLPQSSTNGSRRNKSRSREKEKKNSSCGKKMLDGAESTTTQDPPRNPLTNIITQEGPDLRTQDSSAKSAATNMKRKCKKEKDRNTLKETDFDIHCTIAEFAAKCNSLYEAQGSKSVSIEKTVSQTQSSKPKRRKKKRTKTMEVSDLLGSTLATSLHLPNDLNAGQEFMGHLASKRENSATGEESTFPNRGKGKKKETDENTQVNEDVVAEMVCDARSKKQKGKKKKMSSADLEICDQSRYTVLATVKSGSVECLLDQSDKEHVKNGDGNAGQEFSGEATTSKSDISATREENVLTDNDSLVTNQIGKADEVAPSQEKKVEGNETSTWEDQVHLSENSLSTLAAKSCRQDSVLCEETGAILHHTVPVFSTREDSALDASRNGSSRKKSRNMEKKKEDTFCEEAEIITDEDQVFSPKNPLSNSMIQEGSGQHTHKLCENLAAANIICSQKRKRKKERDRNTMKEGDVDIHCSATEYNTISEAEGSKSMGVGEIVPQTQSPKAKKRKKRRTKTVEVCDPLGNTSATCMQSEPVECVENNDLNACQELMSNVASKRENSATGEERSFQNLGKTKKKVTDENNEVDEDAVGVGVCHSRSKKQKTKKKKTSSADHKTAESGSAEFFLDHSNREDMENCDGNAGKEFVGDAMTSKPENSAAREKSDDVEGTVSNQDALGAEGFSKVEVKTKKRKKKKRENSLDRKTDDMEEEETDDVSSPENDGEPKLEKEKPETSFSSSVLIHNNVAQAVASSETRLLRCSCGGQSTRKLVVLDLNGILADVVQGNTGPFVPDGNVSYRKIFRRPFVASFLEFCFERFDVGIWSSRRVGLDYMINIVMRNHARNLLFCFDQHICTVTKFNTKENSTKPLFLKDLRRVWDRYETCFTCEKRKYDETNTLLIDDSPHKALCNPPYTGIFPWPYQYTDREDNALGPEGDLRKYLARLADAEDVQKFVEENPFGQTAITEAHESWEYYSKVIEAHKSNHQEEEF